MDFKKMLLAIATFFGYTPIPDVVNHDMSSEVEETSAERTARFAELVAVEEEIKEDKQWPEEYSDEECA